jgi:hypothetical protein
VLIIRFRIRAVTEIRASYSNQKNSKTSFSTITRLISHKFHNIQPNNYWRETLVRDSHQSSTDYTIHANAVLLQFHNIIASQKPLYFREARHFGINAKTSRVMTCLRNSWSSTKMVPSSQLLLLQLRSVIY